MPRDEPLLQALRHGLPESYGVALGVDRLLMVITGNQRLAKCMTFGGGSMKDPYHLIWIDLK